MGQPLLGLTAHLAKVVEGFRPAGVNTAGDQVKGPTHQRKGQQGHGGQPPVDADGHHRQHQQQGEAAIKGGQQRLAGRLLHRVHIVGGQRHQVAAALALEVAGGLAAQLVKQLHPQPLAEAERGTKQQLAPGHAQPVDRQPGAEQQPQLKQQGAAGQPASHHGIDHLADMARDPDAKHSHPGEQQRGTGIGAFMLPDKGGHQPAEAHRLALPKRRLRVQRADCSHCAARLAK